MHKIRLVLFHFKMNSAPLDPGSPRSTGVQPSTRAYLFAPIRRNLATGRAASDGRERFCWPATSPSAAKLKRRRCVQCAGGRIEAYIEGQLMGTGGLHSGSTTYI